MPGDNNNTGTPKQNNFVRILEEAQLVTPDVINKAMVLAEEAGQSLRDTLIETGQVTEEDILQATADKMGMDIIDLDELKLDPSVKELITERVAKHYKVFPIRKEADDTLVVAISDPFDVQLADDLKIMLGSNLKMVIAKEEQIERAIKKYYEGHQVEELIQQFNEEQQQQTIEEFNYDEVLKGTAQGTGELSAEDGAIVNFVNTMFRQAIHDRASDIHVEPFARTLKIRFRIDGVLHEMTPPPKRAQNAILSRLKLMSGMDLAEKRIPQDGRIKLNLDNKNLDVRVNALPALYGESIVMRILDQSTVLLGLEDVGFSPYHIELFEQQIKKPNGILLMTGPTGSGKTTTLYAALSAINTVDKKLITVENPVEYQITGINQVQVNADIGLTFSVGLRSMLRQSPDVILVGEIRDTETAEIAVRAALTGHLVFSTLHTNDAPSATVRLIDMGIKPFLVASSVQAIVAQRLVRRICNACKEPFTPDKETLDLLGVPPNERDGVQLMRGRGCDKCSFSGYKGRTAIHEMMIMNDIIRAMVMDREAASVIKKRAREYGMRTLREDGFEKVLMGQTTVDEIMRITQLDEG
jgi:type IV-A pilus assembly ATPase PilB